MNRFFRSVSVLCAAIVTILTIFPVNAAATANTTTAHWHGCYGATCRGKDPQVMGCATDAVTLAVRPYPGTASAGYNQDVELRYSAACNARWARVTSRLAAGQIVYTTAYIAFHPLTRVTRYGARVVWSRMWSGLAQGCGVSVWTGDPTYKPANCAP